MRWRAIARKPREPSVTLASRGRACLGCLKSTDAANSALVRISKSPCRHDGRRTVPCNKRKHIRDSCLSNCHPLGRAGFHKSHRIAHHLNLNQKLPLFLLWLNLKEEWIARFWNRACVASTTQGPRPRLSFMVLYLPCDRHPLCLCLSCPCLCNGHPANS